MSCDPTGAARTALPSNEATEKRAAQFVGRCDEGSKNCNWWYTEGRRDQHAATLSHLAAQGGPEVRGLVEDMLAARLAAESEEGGSNAANFNERKTALLAAYAAKDEQTEVCVELYARIVRAVAEALDNPISGPGSSWHDLGEKVAALRQQRDEANTEALALLRVIAPQVAPLPTVAGKVTQINNYIAGLLAEAASERQRAERACAWREDEDGVWETECGKSWCFDSGSPAENSANFCHNCGGHLKPFPYEEPTDDAD